MAAPSAVGSFPSPYEIETPPGCEGWEDMYPYYARFDEERREADEQRFWFWNSMHFPVPMPAFDAVCVDSPYQAIGNWQNRVFAVPPAMGIDWRCINGYIYISGNPVTRPGEDRRARGVLPEARRLLLRELGRALREVAREDGRADRGARRAPGAASCAEYEPDAVAFEDDEHRFCAVLEAYRRALRLARPDVAAPLRVPAARLRRVHDVRRALQGEPAGHPRPAHRADGRGHRRAALQAGRGAAPARAARDRHRRRRRVRRGALAGGDRRRARRRATPGARWLAELEDVKDPWFHMATGDGLYHTYTSWLDDPRIPYASLIGHIGALKAGEDIERPTDQHRARARPAGRRNTARC